jgi:hypothetical protein
MKSKTNEYLLGEIKDKELALVIQEEKASRSQWSAAKILAEVLSLREELKKNEKAI